MVVLGSCQEKREMRKREWGCLEIRKFLSSCEGKSSEIQRIYGVAGQACLDIGLEFGKRR